MHAGHAQDDMQLPEGVLVKEDADNLVNDLVPVPATALLPLTQSDTNLETLDRLQCLSGDELGERQGLEITLGPRREAVDHQEARLENGPALPGDLLAQQQNCESLGTALPGREVRGCVAGPASRVVLVDLSAVLRVQGTGVGPVAGVIVYLVANLGRKPQEAVLTWRHLGDWRVSWHRPFGRGTRSIVKLRLRCESRNLGPERLDVRSNTATVDSHPAVIIDGVGFCLYPGRVIDRLDC